MTAPDAEPVSHPPECVCTPIGYDGNVRLAGPTKSGPPPIWINAACPVHGGRADAPDIPTTSPLERERFLSIVGEALDKAFWAGSEMAQGYDSGEAAQSVLDLLTKGKGRE